MRQRKDNSAGTEKEAVTQHGKGRLTARELIDLLIDSGTYTENDTLVMPRYESFLGGKRTSYGDAEITGFG
jgi:propionyl-CoA carboxylase beta chain